MELLCQLVELTLQFNAALVPRIQALLRSFPCVNNLNTSAFDRDTSSAEISGCFLCSIGKSFGSEATLIPAEVQMQTGASIVIEDFGEFIEALEILKDFSHLGIIGQDNVYRVTTVASVNVVTVRRTRIDLHLVFIGASRRRYLCILTEFLFEDTADSSEDAIAPLRRKVLHLFIDTSLCSHPNWSDASEFR